MSYLAASSSFPSYYEILEGYSSQFAHFLLVYVFFFSVETEVLFPKASVEPN